MGQLQAHQGHRNGDRHPDQGPGATHVQQGQLVLDLRADLDEGPKGADNKGDGRRRDEVRQGHVQPVAPGHYIVAHFVGPQDQQQGEGKRDALVKEQGIGEQVHPLLQGPGGDGGGHRGQQQHQVQAQAVLSRGRRLSELAPEVGPFPPRLRRRGRPGSFVRGHCSPTASFRAAISAGVSLRYTPRASRPNRRGPKAMRFSFRTGCPIFSIRRFTR